MTVTENRQAHPHGHDVYEPIREICSKQTLRSPAAPQAGLRMPGSLTWAVHTGCERGHLSRGGRVGAHMIEHGRSRPAVEFEAVWFVVVVIVTEAVFGSVAV